MLVTTITNYNIFSHFLIKRKEDDYTFQRFLVPTGIVFFELTLCDFSLLPSTDMSYSPYPTVQYSTVQYSTVQ